MSRFRVLSSALTAAVLAGLLSGPLGGVLAGPANASTTAVTRSALPETAAAVAIANDGTMAVALFEAKSVGLISPTGTLRTVALDCSPGEVAIAPDASYAWAACLDSTSLFVVNVADASVSVVDMEMRDVDSIVYLPSLKRLVIGSLNERILVISARDSRDYEILSRTPTPGARIATVAPEPNGNVVHAITDSGQLVQVDLRSGKVATIPLNVGFLLSLAISPTGSVLYAGAVTQQSASSLVAIDAVTGRVLQQESLVFQDGASTPISLALGHRSLIVGTGLGTTIEDQRTGFFRVALDNAGRMGERTTMQAQRIFSGALARSADAQRIALADTNSAVAGYRSDEAPYAPELRISSVRCTGSRLNVRGVATALPVRTQITVFVRDLGRKNSKAVAQRTAARVTGGSYTWQGRGSSARVEVYVVAGALTSARVRCGR